MQTQTQNALERTDNEPSVLTRRGYWRDLYTDTHPDECSHPRDRVRRYGRTDYVGCPVIHTTCTNCGLTTDQTEDLSDV